MYYPQMTCIDTESHQLKAHKMRGATLEDTYNLAMNVMARFNRQGT
jgi:hypothetical protein